ncbi:flocculation protein FLO11-like [Centruroides sculpturatus]|uniref:flocculation protein FLO11-like n=1 Tax=Centruroides sculpturatus TaxID=218467 RepID=UPI000C6CD637|nr:flocculation protein FLO11-like [Centruroides sculpturatus]
MYILYFLGQSLERINCVKTEIDVLDVHTDDSIMASKSINASLIPEVLSTVSSVVSTTSMSSALSLSTVSTTDSMPHNLPKMQSSMTTSSLASANSLLHNTSSGSQSSSAHASLSSQVTTACSFQVAGMLTNPHTNTIQVITQPGGVKVIAAPNPLGNNTSVGHSTSTPTVQNGPLHILTSTASLMAISAQNATGTSSVVTSSPKTTGTQSLVRVAPIPGVNSAKQLMPPLTLVASQAVMGVTQVTTATKSIIINQVAGLTGLTTSSAGTTESSNSGIVKSLAITSSSTVTTTTMLTAKGSNQAGNVLTSVTTAVPSQSNAVTALQTTKSLSHIVQSGMTGRSIATPQILPTAVPASQINNVGRHIVAASIKSVSPAARSSLSQLSGVAHVTHVMPQSPVAASVGHIVSAGSHVSAVTPLVTPMSMVSHSATVHHPQVYSAQPQLGKVITSPVLKSVGQIPIIPQQFLQPAVGSVAAQPVVVVSMAAASNGPQTSAATSSANKQPGTINVPVTQ